MFFKLFIMVHKEIDEVWVEQQRHLEGIHDTPDTNLYRVTCPQWWWMYNTIPPPNWANPYSMYHSMLYLFFICRGGCWKHVGLHVLFLCSDTFQRALIYIQKYIQIPCLCWGKSKKSIHTTKRRFAYIILHKHIVSCQKCDFHQWHACLESII